MSLPPGFAASIAQHIHAYGEDVVFVPQAPVAAARTPIKALVQRPGSTNLISGATMEVLTVIMVPGDLPQEPVHFDRLEIDGISHAIDPPWAHRAAGVLLAYEARCAG